MMTETEKQNLKDKMLPKFASVSKLSQQERRTYMERQSNTDKLDFSKINVIMMQEMQQLQVPPSPLPLPSPSPSSSPSHPHSLRPLTPSPSRPLPFTYRRRQARRRRRL